MIVTLNVFMYLNSEMKTAAREVKRKHECFEPVYRKGSGNGVEVDG